jgi:polar amino acid transport system substrate-binding protein
MLAALPVLRNLLLAVWWGFAGCGSALAQTITIAFEEWPPYEHTVKGEAVGIDVDVVREAAKRVGINVLFTSLPWARALIQVNTGKVDAIFSISKTPERMRLLDFADTHLSVERKVFFTNKNSPLVITKFGDLNGKKLGLVRGNNYGDKLAAQTGFERYEASSQELLLRMLAANRFDAAITSDLVGYCTARTLGLTDHFVQSPLVVTESNLYIAFSKSKGTAAKHWANEFGKVLSQMRAEGYFDKASKAQLCGL